LNVLKKDGMVNIFVRSEIVLPQCNTVCILLLIYSKSQPNDDPMGSKHGWILYKVGFNGHLFILYCTCFMMELVWYLIIIWCTALQLVTEQFTVLLYLS